MGWGRYDFMGRFLSLMTKPSVLSTGVGVVCAGAACVVLLLRNASKAPRMNAISFVIALISFVTVSNLVSTLSLRSLISVRTAFISSLFS